MNDTNEYYLYQGNVYHCSECTTEAELYGADCFYGYGKALLFLDELGEYVDVDDCVNVKSPNLTIWQPGFMRMFIGELLAQKIGF